MSRRPPRGDGSVGRGNPPVHSRFQPGQSGNPRGRPKRSKNLVTLLEAELNQVVTIMENGRRIKLSKLELVVKQAVNKAVVGEHRMLLDLRKQSGADQAGQASNAPETVLGGEEDEQILLDMIQQLRDPSDEG